MKTPEMCYEELMTCRNVLFKMPIENYWVHTSMIPEIYVCLHPREGKSRKVKFVSIEKREW